MENQFTIFIDESGEAGLKKIRSESSGGASPYMTLGAALIANDDREAIENTLTKIRDQLRKKTLHCCELNHYQILYFARQIIKQNMRLFGVISYKETLDEYSDAIDNNSKMYYNKCAQYLLERVGWFMQSRNIPPQNLNIVFEDANVDYAKMCNLLRTCQSNPKHPNTKKLQYIDIGKITVKKKKEEPFLELADLVAHALYKCVDKQSKNFNILEPRYCHELAPRFFGHPENQKVVSAGLYCVHKIQDLKLDKDVEKVLTSMVATSPKPKYEVR